MALSLPKYQHHTCNKIISSTTTVVVVLEVFCPRSSPQHQDRGSSRRGLSLLVSYERETWVGSNGSFMLSSITIGFMLYAAETTRRNIWTLKSNDYSFIVLSSWWSINNLPLLSVAVSNL